MLIEETVMTWLKEKFTEESFSDCFVVEVSFKQNRLAVYLDSDQGLNLDRCAVISRWLGHKIEEIDLIPDAFTLEVSSTGLDRPLQQYRQYLKNVGREVTVHLESGKTVEGKLAEVRDGLIVLTSEIVEKEKNKKVKKNIETLIHLSDVKKTFIQIKF